MTAFAERARPAATVDVDDFKFAMRNTAASVNIITCRGADGDYGLTATAFSSVTVDPPTVLIAVNSLSGIYRHLLEQKSFCVNVLSSAAEVVARDFAGGLPREQRFGRHGWSRLDSGNPALDDSIAGFDCRATEFLHVGSHLVVVAEVGQCWRSEQAPLLYSSGLYGHFVPVT